MNEFFQTACNVMQWDVSAKRRPRREFQGSLLLFFLNTHFLVYPTDLLWIKWPKFRNNFFETKQFNQPLTNVDILEEVKKLYIKISQEMSIDEVRLVEY